MSNEKEQKKSKSASMTNGVAKEEKNVKNDKVKKSLDNALKATEKIAELSEKLKQKDEKITELEKQLKETHENALRIRADAENYRKRIEKDVEFSRRLANEGLIKELLPSIDSLRLAINGANDENVKKGLQIVFDAIYGALKKWDLEELDVLGKEFDPNTCEAFLYEEDPEREFDTVIEVLQTGYMYKGKVLRSAKVKVARCGK